MRYSMALVVVAAAVAGAGAQSIQPAGAAAPTRFEVASVRATPRGTAGGMINTQPGGRFIVVNMSLASVITTAYGIRPFQLVDVPGWAQSERFDITALTGRDDYPSVVDMRPLIQALLAERFQLEVSREPRPMQTYALVRVRSDALGPDLRASDVDCSNPALRDPARSPLTCGTRSPAPGTLLGNAVSFGLVASALTTRLNTVVVDETGLKDVFDFSLKWAVDQAVDSPALSDGPSLFTAIQEQLGLRLDPRRTPVDVVVIKRVARPTEN